MRVVAFSDWRLQDIDDVIRFIEDLLPEPDVILYAGDDVGRFGR